MKDNVYAAVMQSLPALPAGTSVPQPAGQDPEGTKQLEMGSLAVLSRQGSVKGYSRAVVKVSFIPPAAGPVRQQISIQFRYSAITITTVPLRLITPSYSRRTLISEGSSHNAGVTTGEYD